MFAKGAAGYLFAGFVPGNGNNALEMLRAETAKAARIIIVPQDLIDLVFAGSRRAFGSSLLGVRGLSDAEDEREEGHFKSNGHQFTFRT